MRWLAIPLVFATLAGFTQDDISKKDFKRFQFLIGTWRLLPIDESAATFEIWQRAGDTQLVGKSVRLDGGDSLLMETLELIWKDGAMQYTARVPNQNEGKPVSFTLTGINDNRFIFENPEHDFPQRIIYHLISKSDLEVVLDAPYAEPPGAVRHIRFKRQ